MHKITIAGLAAGLVASPAAAQSANDFSGFRLEALGGLDEFEDDEGAVYGAAAGYDIRSGNWVFGATGEITDSSTEECATSVIAAGDEVCAQVGREFYVGGRVGHVIADNLLLYGGLGYTNTRLRIVTTDPTGAETRIASNFDGVRATLGLELAISDNAFARAELRGTALEEDFERGQLIGGLGIRF
ncbi:MAG: outer membrane protein [Parasphingopyxis sp.]|uniref:outer membrane protein n=1 Tax=Parasphingopyxis sp. TaxID=1920299 RepID=UPI003FA11896